MLIDLKFDLYWKLNNKLIIIFNRQLMIINFNLFNIDLIDIYFKIIMIKNIIV